MNGPIDTGGFVYPIYLDEENLDKQVVSYGITRRDWLAGLAMSGMAGAGSDKDSMHPKTALEIAQTAYHIADLMIRVSKDAAEEERLLKAKASV